MDQVKVYLGVAKKHHFWILVAIIVITALVVWIKASSTLSAKYDADKRTITGAEDSVQKLNSSEQVNDSFRTKVEKLHEGLKNQVFEAWQKLYDRQVVLFKWPDLSDFDDNIDLNKLRPEEEIPLYVRTYYNEKKIVSEWRSLLEQIPIRQQKKQSEESDENADNDENADEEKRGVEYEGLVVWKPELREAIANRYYVRGAAPSTMRLRLMQEDIWLFEALVQVVNTVNVGASDSLKAPIKEILTLDVAQWAIAASLESGSSIWTPASKSGAGGMGASGAMPMGMGMPAAAGAPAASGMPPPGGAAGAMPGMPTPGAAPSTGNDDNDWLADRYLDDKGQPLKDPTKQQPFAEFRQVFVYMKFIMDQRRIPELVAACANAQLPIETRQIRVQMLKADGGGLFPGGGMPGGMGGGMGGIGGGMGGMGGGMGGMGGGMGGMGASAMPGGRSGMSIDPNGPGMGGMGGGMPNSGPMAGGDMMGGAFGGGGLGGLGSGLAEGGVETTVFDALVELSGVIYLYSPPDIAKLGTGTAGSPEKRSFGVPTTSVHVPGSTAGGGMSNMMAPTATGSGGR